MTQPPREDAEQGFESASVGETIEQGRPREQVASAPAVAPRGLSRRLVAIVVVAILIGASGVHVWAEYFAPRSIDDLAECVINDRRPPREVPSTS